MGKQKQQQKISNYFSTKPHLPYLNFQKDEKKKEFCKAVFFSSNKTSQLEKNKQSILITNKIHDNMHREKKRFNQASFSKKLRRISPPLNSLFLSLFTQNCK